MTKKCKVCKKDNANPMNPVCSVPCAIEWAKTDNAKAYKEKAVRSETRQRKKVFVEKDRSYWIKKAQIEFNKFIRLRDKDEDCISCGVARKETAVSTGSNFHAGHYKSRGAFPELRYDEENCHKQCAYCNNHLSGNVDNYRFGLIEKIGLDRVLLLEGPHKPKKYTIDELKDLIQHYRKLNNNH
jgi:hypothetical protein